MTRSTQKLLAAGFLAGVIFGAVVWSVQIKRSRRDLFSKHAVKRLATRQRDAAYAKALAALELFDEELFAEVA